MKAIKLKHQRQERRRHHVRTRVRGSAERPRLSVNRSLKHISAQLVDDVGRRTLATATSTAKALTDELQGKTKSQRAAVVGAEIARKAAELGVGSVVFDRGHCKYHGRVKALAEAAREGGLKF